MRYILAPGQPVRVVFDPWGIEIRVRDRSTRARARKRSASGGDDACTSWSA